MTLVLKNPRASAGDMRDASSVPELGRFPGGGHGNPFQYSLEEARLPVAGEFHGQRGLVGYSPWVAKNWTQLSD